MPKTNTTNKKILKPEKKSPAVRRTRVIVKSESKSKNVVTKKTASGISLPLFDAKGKEAGNISVPVELFGQKLNTQLLTQAIRVYQEHQRQYNASVKTRGEVSGSTKKIYKQKGTGRARHGPNRAPIFVHGGIAHGPKVKNTKLPLPTKMRRRALFSALSNQRNEGVVYVLEKFTTIEPKSNIIVRTFLAMNVFDNTLIVVGTGMDDHIRAMKNIAHLDVLRAKDLNAYEVMKHKKVVFIKESLEELEKTFIK